MTPRELLRSARAATRRGDPVDPWIARACDAADSALRTAPADGVAWARAAAELAAAPGASDAAAWRGLRGLAKALHGAGDVQGALRALDELPRRLLTPARRADVAAVRAILLARAGHVAQSSRAAASARRLFRQLRDAAGLAHVDVNEANALHRRDEHAKALRLYRRALRTLERAGRDSDAAAALVGIGNTGTFLGRIAEAGSAYRRAEAIFAKAGREHARLVAAYNRHYLALVDGRAQDALDGLAQVEAGFTAIGDERAVTQCRLDRAEVFAYLRCWPEAAEAASRSRDACARLGLGVEAARAALVLGRAEHALGRRSTAEARLREAEDAFTAQADEAGADLSRVLRSQALRADGDPDEAAKLAATAARRLAARGQAARAAAARVAEAEALVDCGARRGAARAARAARALRGAGDWATVEAETLLSELALAVGDVAAARRLGGSATRRLSRLAAGLLSDGARLSLTADLDRAPRAAIAAELAGTPRPERALAIAEQARRFGLVEPSLREGRAALSAWARAGRGGGQAPAARGLRRAEAPDAPHARHRAESGRDFPLLDAAGIRARLEPGEVLIEIVAWPDAEGRAPRALVMTRDGLKVVVLPVFRFQEAGAALADRAERLAMCSALAPDAAGAARAALLAGLDELGHLVLDPLTRWIQSARRVMVAPPGDLAALPWPALTWRGRPFGEHAEVVVLPAAAWLARRDSRDAVGSVAIGCADAAAPLVEREVRAVARAARGTALAGKDATAPAFARAAAHARVLHVAGHGAFRWDAPERSALRFADGWISAAEVERLPLRCDLVTLSACLAGGARASGAQALGLVRAFLRAGARRVAATPWSVPDALAAELWPAVHVGLAEGLAPSAALRRAQLARSRSDSPLAWSFTLHGRP